MTTTSALALGAEPGGMDLRAFAAHTAAALGAPWTVAEEDRPGGCGVKLLGPSGQALVLTLDVMPRQPRVAAVALYPEDNPARPTTLSRLAVSVRREQGPAALAAAIRAELPRYADQLARCAYYVRETTHAQAHTARVATARHLCRQLPGAQLMHSTRHAVTLAWTSATGPGRGDAMVTGDDGGSVRLTITGAQISAATAAAILVLLAAEAHRD